MEWCNVAWNFFFTAPKLIVFQWQHVFECLFLLYYSYLPTLTLIECLWNKLSSNIQIPIITCAIAAVNSHTFWWLQIEFTFHKLNTNKIDVCVRYMRSNCFLLLFFSGYAHFLKGKQYWKFSPVGVEALEGYPRFIGMDFFNCPANK